jgi:hypothetical protein
MANSTVTQYIQGGNGEDVGGWGKFNASGAISDSYNITSVTDNGTGDFTVNFTSAFPSSNFGLGYSTFGGTGSQDDFTSHDYSSANTTTSNRVAVYRRGTNAKADPTFVCICAIQN